MIKLIKLELQRVNLRPYLVSSALFGVILLGFTYFVAYVAQLEQEVQLMNYVNIFRFTGAISTILFGILSATMYARLIIGECSGKRLALLFSYPVGRKKIVAAKLWIVFFYILLSMLLCTIVPICMFTATEAFAPIVSDTMTSSILAEALGNIAVSLAAVSAIGLLAMRIGFIKKSVSVTLISAFILCGLYGNVSVSVAGNLPASLLIAVISVIAVFTIFITLLHKTDHMEVL